MLGTVLLGMLTIGTWKAAGDSNQVVQMLTPQLSVGNSPVIHSDSPQSATVNGSVPGMVSNVKYNGSCTVPTDAGTYAITADFIPTDGANYSNLMDAAAGDFTINKAVLTYTANAVSIKYGDAIPYMSGDVTGFVPDDYLDICTVVFTTSATSNSAPGSYAINGCGLWAANYTFVQADGNATALTILAPDNPSPTLSRNPLRLTCAVGETLHIEKSQLVANVTAAVNGDSLSCASQDTPGVGTLTDAGSFLDYNQGASGTKADSFSYTVSESNGTSVTGTVKITMIDPVLQATPITGQVGTGANAGQFGITFYGQLGKTYHIYRSTDVFATSIDLGSVTATNTPATFWDNSPPNGSAEYQVALP